MFDYICSFHRYLDPIPDQNQLGIHLIDPKDACVQWRNVEHILYIGSTKLEYAQKTC